MKKLFTILFIYCASHAHAAEPTLVEKSDWLNFYFQPELTLTEVKSDSAELAGAEVGISINNRLDIGIAGHVLINDLDLGVDGVADPREGQLWYAGPVIRYHFTPCDLIDVGLQLAVYGGRIDVGYKSDGTHANTDFMLVEPSLYLGVNLTDNVTIGTRLGYHIANGSNSRQIKDSELDNFAAAFFIRFEEF